MNKRTAPRGGTAKGRPVKNSGALRTGIALLGAVVLLAACGGEAEQAPQGGPMQAMAVQVHVLRPGVLDNRLTTTGTLLANEEVEIVSELAGRVQALNFQEGGGVAAGQVLVHINDDELQAQLRKAEANLKLAQDDEARKKQLLAVKGISQEQYDAAMTQMAALQADVDDLRARVAKCTIRAPFNGTVGLRMVSEGGYVAPDTRIAT
ncbi:MAG TPA: efflux RND transporter periplasmic adaptor subunit, partial [Flavobacteriales bacterium]|nr:efflux RND transporter periplasmic adaptor subunit [Flavobacteriales bacterium]